MLLPFMCTRASEIMKIEKFMCPSNYSLSESAHALVHHSLRELKKENEVHKNELTEYFFPCIYENFINNEKECFYGRFLRCQRKGKFLLLAATPNTDVCNVVFMVHFYTTINIFLITIIPRIKLRALIFHCNNQDIIQAQKLSFS